MHLSCATTAVQKNFAVALGSRSGRVGDLYAARSCLTTLSVLSADCRQPAGRGEGERLLL